jgi:hypothetical protein
MRRALQIVLLGHGIAEQCNEAIADLVGNFTTPFSDCGGSGVEVSSD